MNVGITTFEDLKAEVPVDVKATVQAIASVPVSCLAEVRAQLLASGAIKIEDEPDLEEGLPEEEDEGEFDSSDEDEERSAEPDDERETVDDPFNGIFRRDNFEIRVVKYGDEWRCDVPQSGWEGVVGCSPYGKTVVNVVSTRLQVYQFLAMWLEANHQNFLASGPFGPKEPLLRSQKELLNARLEDEQFKGLQLKDILNRAKGGMESSLSRYLENVDLVWAEGALPLKECIRISSSPRRSRL